MDVVENASSTRRQQDELRWLVQPWSVTTKILSQLITLSAPPQTTTNKHSAYTPVHCEVALAMHFLSQDLDGPPPLPFVGVSKLSCFGCWSLLKSLQHARAQIATMETHGKAFFPYKYPEEELYATQYASQAAKVKEDVYLIFADQYTTCIVARRMEIGLIVRGVKWGTTETRMLWVTPLLLKIVRRGSISSQRRTLQESVRSDLSEAQSITSKEYFKEESAFIYE